MFPTTLCFTPTTFLDLIFTKSCLVNFNVSLYNYICGIMCLSILPFQRKLSGFLNLFIPHAHLFIRLHLCVVSYVYNTIAASSDIFSQEKINIKGKDERGTRQRSQLLPQTRQLCVLSPFSPEYLLLWAFILPLDQYPMGVLIFICSIHLVCNSFQALQHMYCLCYATHAQLMCNNFTFSGDWAVSEKFTCMSSENLIPL